MTVLFIVLTLCALAMVGVVLWQTHQQKVRIENWRAVEAERKARENAYPLGNVTRWP